MVYVTAPDHACALKLAHACVDARLAACANIAPNVTSDFTGGRALPRSIGSDPVSQTTPDLFERLEENIKANHPYANPCIVALRLEGGCPYLDWINDSVKKDL